MAALSIAGCGATAVSAPSHRLALESIALHVPLSVPTGSPLSAELVITNRTGATIRSRPCTRNWIVLGLETARLPYKLPIPPADCEFHLVLRPGVNRFQVSIPTIHAGCGLPRIGPPCNAFGRPPDLPVGTYHLELAATGLRLSPKLHFGALPTVTLGPPTWETALRPGQGSLLVATSACIATAFIAPPSHYPVWVIVRQHAHVFEHATGHMALVATYALSPGTYYVNTDLAWRHGFVRIRAGRQTVDNLDADCI